MLRIIVVEDNGYKLQKISSVLTQHGCSLESIDHVPDIYSAKQKLRNTFYDLLILDIAIPGRINEEVRQDGGIKLLEEITTREMYITPAHIVGITGFENILSEAQERFSKELLTVIFFDPTSDDWENRIRAKIHHIESSKASQTEVQPEYQSDLAIICALEKPELSSILDLNWPWERIKLINDDTFYYKACVNINKERRVFYAAAAAKMGMPAAAVLATKIIAHFRPKYLVMTGITAGYRDKTKLGDIIVADPAWDWGSGKWVAGSDFLHFLPEPHQLDIDPSLRNKFKLIEKDQMALFKIRKDFKGETPSYDLSLHIGPIASGSAVLADGDICKRIEESQHRKILGIEMETYAVYLAAKESMSPKPYAFSIKSVVDFGDGKKDDTIHKYASYTSAAILQHFAENYLFS